MAVIDFYEKPGCRANARQKQLLEQAGHHLVVHDLLIEPWTCARLRRFFGRRPVTEWFNPSAPAIKSGQVLPEQVAPKQALRLMLEDPLLIRRPLMQANGRRWSGFDPNRLDGLLSHVPDPGMERCLNPGSACQVPDN